MSKIFESIELNNLKLKNKIGRKRKKWHAMRDSNPRPSGSKPDTLSS